VENKEAFRGQVYHSNLWTKLEQLSDHYEPPNTIIVDKIRLIQNGSDKINILQA
jgi:hypothetical protein